MILELVQDPGLLILLQPGDEQLGGIAFNTDLRSKSNNGNVGAHLCVRPLGGTRWSPPTKRYLLTAGDHGLYADGKTGGSR